MGQRSLLALVSLLALGAGLALWWSSPPDRGRSPLPGAAEPSVAAAETRTDDAMAPLRPGVESAPRAAAELPTRSQVAAAPGEPSEEDSVGGLVLSGRVVDRLGNPVPGARVQVVSPEGFAFALSFSGLFGDPREAVTGAGGAFEIAGVESGTTGIRVTASGFAPYERRDLVLPADASFELPVVTLEPGAILSGRVLDRDGAPVSGAALHPVDPDDPFAEFGALEAEPAAVSAEDGSFRLDTMPLGSWKLLVRSDDHPTGTFTGLADVPGKEVGGLEFVLADGETIRGRGVSLPDGAWKHLQASASKASESWGSWDRSTAPLAADGSFLLRGLEAGEEYEVRLEERPEGGDALRGPSRSRQVTAFAGTEGLEVPYQLGAALLFRVVDARTGEPLEDFEALGGIDWIGPLKAENGSVLRHHPGGRARFGDLRPDSPSDRASLTIRAAGYEELALPAIALLPGQELDLGDLRLEPVPTLRIHVLDRLTGEPISGAHVALTRTLEGESTSFDISSEGVTRTDRSTQTATTDAHGDATLSSAEGEVVQLAVTHDDYARAAFPALSLPHGQDVERTVELGPGGTVVVHVYDPAGEPVPGASVVHRTGDEGEEFGFFGPPAEVTDSEGQVTFSHLEPGSHEFRVSEQGPTGGAVVMGGAAAMIRMAGEEPAGPEWDAVEVIEGESVELVLQAQARGTLTGRVFEAGRALVGASVRTEEDRDGEEQHMFFFGGLGGGGGVRTGAGGAFRIEDLVVGSYTLVVEHPTRAMPARIPFELEPGDNEVNVDLEVTRIEGRITDESGAPLAGLRVRAQRADEASSGRAVILMQNDDGDTTGGMIDSGDLGAGGTTDADGRYSLRGVLPDTELIVVASGRSVQEGRSEPVTVASGRTERGVDFTLAAAGRIRLDLLDAAGEPVVYRMVMARPAEEEDEESREYALTDQQGVATFSGLAPGRWLVWAADPSDPDAQLGASEVEVVSGSETPLLLHVP